MDLSSYPVALSIGLVLSYLLGAIPFGWLLAKGLKGIDLRHVGSGNIGATNAGRALGKWAGLLVYLLDFVKGWAPAYFFPGLLGLPDSENWIPVAFGSVAVAGHCFPVYLGFRGGKGVATTTGVLVGLDPWVFLLSGGVWLLLLGLTRYVAIASIGLGFSLPLWIYVLEPAKIFGERLPFFLFGSAVALFILFTHRANIRRLLNGEEPKLGAKL